MYFSLDLLNNLQSPAIYISNPNHKILKPLLGICSARANFQLRDIWEIDFEVDAFMSDRVGVRVSNPSYELITHSREVWVENIGWFRINTYPSEQIDDNGRKYKSFTAYGYETTLQDLDLVGININCGTEDSIEMYEENLDVFGVPMHNIQLYIKDANEDPKSDKYWKLGLLNILEHEYLHKKGWRIGDIDIGVAPLKGRQFEIDSENIYAFLTQDVSNAYRCMFWFDRINKTINAVKVENLGKDLNLELSFRNVLTSMSITDQNDDFYTCFRVAGNNADDTLLEYINYGSDKIYNLDYCITAGMLEESTVTKYKAYTEFLEKNRLIYADYSKEHLKLLEKKSVLYEQLPIEEVDMLFTNVSDEELTTELEHFRTILATLEKIYTVDGKLQIEGTTDYALYVSVRDVMIPKIQAEIDARKEGKHAEDFEYQTNWELYGINELEARLVSYQRQIDLMKEKHYDQPWKPEFGGTEASHNKQHELYKEYAGYIDAINARLKKLKAQAEEIENQIKTVTGKQKDLAEQAKIENEVWGFTKEELQDIYTLYRETDFQDSSIEVLDTDTIDDIIQLAQTLYDNAKEELEIESHPQFAYDTDMDNLYHNLTFLDKANTIDLGDFCYLELDNGFKTKQRVVRIELELVNFNDNNMVIEFSNMTSVCGRADDYRFLLEGGGGSQKNQISRDTANYISDSVSSIASKILSKYFQSGGSIFPNGISQGDLQKLQDALDGLIGGSLSVEELKVILAKVDTLEANSAFVKYLQAQSIIANKGQFDELTAKFAAIDDLLAGNISAELGHVIHLTAENVKIDEAVIKKLIAAHIMVSDLQAGDITLTDTMRILSDNGLMVMNGQTLQIMGTTSSGEQYVAIQLGYDAEENPSLIIRDENGAVMLDASGLHENIVPDGFIKNDMVAQGTINKDKLSFDIIEPNEFGGIDITQVFDGKGGQWGVQYDQFKESTENALNNLHTSIKTIELTGEQVFKEDNGVISPATITISAICKGDIKVAKWYIDDVINNAFVSPTGNAITIPATYMGAKKTIAVKAEDASGKYYDIISVYMVSNGDKAITVIVQSSEGYLFKEDTPLESTKCTATVYRGANEIEPVAYKWQAISDDGTEWITIGNTKSIVVTLDSFAVRKRIKCLVDVADPIPEPEDNTITSITDAQIEEILNNVFHGGGA